MVITPDFGDVIAERMLAAHEALAVRWFERLVDLIPVDERNVFPSNSLLDHVPALIREISESLRLGGDAAMAANTSILDKARELGALRHQQRASLHQVLREYQILGGVLVQFVLEEVERLSTVPSASACVFVVSRIHHAVDVLSQTTVEAFVSLYTRTISEQTERLQQFTRMATHEWRQPLGAVQFGISVLQQAGVGDRAQRTLDVVERNVAHLVDLTWKLEAMARLHEGAGDTVVTQTVSLGTVAREAANLFSNAIKYSDQLKPERYVELSGSADDNGCRIVVRDNGIGIPKRAVSTIFQRFTRAHAAGDSLTAVEGVGLGLSIVDECVRAMGGQIEVDSVEGEGTTFLLRLPVSV